MPLTDDSYQVQGQEAPEPLDEGDDDVDLDIDAEPDEFRPDSDCKD